MLKFCVIFNQGISLYFCMKKKPTFFFANWEFLLNNYDHPLSFTFHVLHHHRRRRQPSPPPPTPLTTTTVSTNYLTHHHHKPPSPPLTPPTTTATHHHPHLPRTPPTITATHYHRPHSLSFYPSPTNTAVTTTVIP